ncbi:unnamed protein product [Pylaiella littoralis]
MGYRLRSSRGIGWALNELTVLCCVFLSCAGSGTSTARLHPGHPHAVQRAEFALRELQGLSDTGIFRTLSLKSISAAATRNPAWMSAGKLLSSPSSSFAARSSSYLLRRSMWTGLLSSSLRDGVFHFNTLLTLDLACPYFSSGQKEERFEVVVMEHKEDGHVSFSIDSFPNMDPEAMESFHIQRVEQHRQSRASFFSKIDGQTDGDTLAVSNAGSSDPARLAIRMMDYDSQQLLAFLGEGDRSKEDPLKHAVGVEIARRLEQRTT